jgi:hypothetical protein
MRSLYGWIDDDRIVVTRPAVMSEITAIRTLRTGDSSSFWQEIHDSDFRQLESSRPLRAAVDNMIREGWRRTRADFDPVKQNIWEANNYVVERLLRDL